MYGGSTTISGQRDKKQITLVLVFSDGSSSIFTGMINGDEMSGTWTSGRRD